MVVRVAVESKSRIGVSTGVDSEAGSFLKVADEDENMLLGGMLASRCCACDGDTLSIFQKSSKYNQSGNWGGNMVTILFLISNIKYNVRVYTIHHDSTPSYTSHRKSSKTLIVCQVVFES